MNSVIANEVSGADAAKLIGQGIKLLCPVCGAAIKTVPENWVAGKPLTGIECPNDQKHFMVHYDDAATMKTMRDWMKAQFSKKPSA